MCVARVLLPLPIGARTNRCLALLSQIFFFSKSRSSHGFTSALDGGGALMSGKHLICGGGFAAIFSKTLSTMLSGVAKGDVVVQ